MSIRTKINGIMKRCGSLLSQHYFNIDYTASEELNPYRVVRKQLYNIIELQEVVDLDYRLDILITQAMKDNLNKTKLKKITKMDVIEQSPDLHEKALEVAEKLLRRYENQVFAIHVDIDDIDDVF